MIYLAALSRSDPATKTVMRRLAIEPPRGHWWSGSLALCAVGIVVVAMLDRPQVPPAAVEVTITRVPPQFQPSDALTGTVSILVAGNVGKLADLFSNLDYRLDKVRDGRGTVPRVFVARMPEDLEALQPVTLRKRLFFKTMLPLILGENETIMRERQRLNAVAERVSGAVSISNADREWLIRLAVRYKSDPKNLETLRRRVDVVPPSLALAQAAIESGWGTSRFAQEGRALFGQRTYIDRSGMVPSAQEHGEVFRIRSFQHLADAVKSYIHNLNTHWAYRAFRRQRAQMRVQSILPDGLALARSLERYSERGAAYVRDIRTIIRANDLRPLDSARLPAVDRVSFDAPGA